MPVKLLLVIIFLLIACTGSSFAGNSNETSSQTILTVESKSGENASQVVIYTASYCPHCREAKEYLTNNKIPFVNREVDTDDEHLATLMSIYDLMGVPEEKRGVPLLVIGNRIRLQGFNKDKVQKALKELSVNPK